MDRQNSITFIAGRSGVQSVVEVESQVMAAVAFGGFASGLIDQNSPHGFGGGGEKMPAVVPAGLGLVADEPELGLMNQGRGLQCLSRLFLGELSRSQLPQLVIDQGQEFFASLRIPLLDFGQDAGEIGHGYEDNRQ